MAKSHTEFVLRPFAGLPNEADWVAMREIVPAAVATAKTSKSYGARPVQVVTVLPGGYVAMHRPDGTVLLSLQDALPSADVSRDLAAALLAALDAEPGTGIGPQEVEPDTPRLQDILDLTFPFDVTVHEGYEFWLDAGTERTAETDRSLAEAAEASTPTVRLASVEHAYWCEMNREFVRWVRAEPEDAVVDGLARLQAERAAGFDVGAGQARFLGMFRASGLVVPVWELPDGTGAAGTEAPMAAFAKRFEAAIADRSELTPAQRRARAGIVSRQVTLR